MFDWCNNRNPGGSFNKAPLRESNHEEWKADYAKYKEYILGLHYIDPTKKPPKQMLVTSTNFTPFIGFLSKFRPPSPVSRGRQK